MVAQRFDYLNFIVIHLVLQRKFMYGHLTQLIGVTCHPYYCYDLFESLHHLPGIIEQDIGFVCIFNITKCIKRV